VIKSPLVREGRDRPDCAAWGLLEKTKPQSDSQEVVLYYVGALVERKVRMSEAVLKLVDVAKDVADRYSRKVSPMYDEETMKKVTEEWTTLFDQAYKALKATLAVVED